MGEAASCTGLRGQAELGWTHRSLVGGDLVYEIEGGSITLWIEDRTFLNINQWTGSASQADASLLSAQLGLDPLWIDELIDFTDIDQTRNAGRRGLSLPRVGTAL